MDVGSYIHMYRASLLFFFFFPFSILTRGYVPWFYGERKEGRERERTIDGEPPACALTRDQPATWVCALLESNWWPFSAGYNTQLTEPRLPRLGGKPDRQLWAPEYFTYVVEYFLYFQWWQNKKMGYRLNLLNIFLFNNKHIPGLWQCPSTSNFPESLGKRRGLSPKMPLMAGIWDNSGPNLSKDSLMVL